MGVLFRLLQLLGLNAVPLAGLFFAGWSPATALALYWCENVVGSALVAARIALHRRATRKRGHYRPQLGLQISGSLKVAGRTEPKDVAPKTLLAEFLYAVIAFSIAHGIFLWLLFAVMKVQVEPAQLRTGLVAMVGIQLVGFAWDAWSLAERPFAWIKAMAQRSLGRVILVHLAILGGMFLTASRPHPERFFLVFGALKLASDLASWLPLSLPPPDPSRPPRLVTRLAGPRFAEYWRQEATKERAANEDDERER
ncbi:MAG TPA: DUF6498-containing protein [Myxococcota bacterium]|nr:DUF6498-containing protein [Myxococcota bacterium]